MIIRSWKALVPPKGNLSIFDSKKASVIEPSFFLALEVEKVCGSNTSIAETITSVMRWTQTEGSLTRKQ